MSSPLHHIPGGGGGSNPNDLHLWMGNMEKKIHVFLTEMGQFHRFSCETSSWLKLLVIVLAGKKFHRKICETASFQSVHITNTYVETYIDLGCGMR